MNWRDFNSQTILKGRRRANERRQSGLAV